MKLILVSITIFLLGYTSAQSRPGCDTYENVAKTLKNKFNEVLFSHGVDREGNLIEVYRNNENLTWTIVRTKPRGLTCLLSSGDGWQKRVYNTSEDPEA